MSAGWLAGGPNMGHDMTLSPASTFGVSPCLPAGSYTGVAFQAKSGWDRPQPTPRARSRTIMPATAIRMPAQKPMPAPQ
jgi:hypothetical protein